jgi:hypothetical protein
MRILPLAPLVLVGIISCARGYLVPRAKPGEPNVQLVREMWYPTRAQWKSSPWWRLANDLITPTRVVISIGDWACALGNEVTEPRAQEYYRCSTGWIHPR